MKTHPKYSEESWNWNPKCIREKSTLGHRNSLKPAHCVFLQVVLNGQLVRVRFRKPLLWQNVSASAKRAIREGATGSNYLNQIKDFVEESARACTC